ncbi:MAG: hypothetical protein WHT08_10765 [Bryobacteraceae bacterium]|jgi:hypothetical protein
MRLATTILALMISALWAQAPPVEKMPEEPAYRILFQLLRTRVEGAWGVSAQLLWLKSLGVPEQYFTPLRLASDRYWQAVRPYEEDLREVHLRFAGRNDSPEARVAEKPAREKIAEQYRLIRQDLLRDLDAEGVSHLERLILHIRNEGRRAGNIRGGAPEAGHVH